MVGSGPAGFYTADFLLKKDADVRVHIFDRLPVPYGLVRFGVAPDHQEVKNVTERFAEIGTSERARFLGNVHVGAGASSGGTSGGGGHGVHVPLTALRRQYDAVILAYGSESNRRLGLPGEDLTGVHSARAFVEWYNGHPDAVSHDFCLEHTQTAVVIGHGNVALDVARILAKSVDELATSDIAEHALEALSTSAVSRVHVLGRRGPLHASFTTKELRELTKLGDRISAGISGPPGMFGADVIAAADTDRVRKRLFSLMQKMPRSEMAADARHVDGANVERHVDIRFQCSPIEFLPRGQDAPGVLRAVRVQQTALDGAPSASQRARPVVGSESEIECGLCLSSIGAPQQQLARHALVTP